MTSKTLANGILRAVGILVLTALSLFIIHQISTVIVYLIVSLIFALIATPVVKFLNKKLKFKNTIAVVTTLFLFILLLAGFILLFVPLIINQVDKLSLLDIDSLKQNVPTSSYKIYPFNPNFITDFKL